MKKILVTSALPYVNNIPHLGNVVCVISADVYTRFLRLKEENAISVCGTDEHGTTTEVKALEEGLTPKQVTDKYFKIHKKIYDWFNCSFDCFGRTSSEDNKEVTVDIFKKLNANGYIAEQEIEQSYCEKCNKFLADRYIEGTCPYCGYEEARGDQCENCGKLLNAVELKNPRCKVCGDSPIVKKTKHLFIDLPKIQPELQEWVDANKDKWTGNARTMTDSWLKEGLKLRCITRDLKWGIPVPLKGYESKVFYSWFDAPIGYIGITKENRKDWKEWWHNEDVRLVQFMGKDNIPFHTILFPAFCIGTKDDYTLLDTISVNEYLNYEGGMFSKSRNIGVFGDDAMQSGIPADIWRYYIIVNRPEKTDTEFTWEDLQVKINNELVANIGNLVNRTVTFLNNNFNSEIPDAELTEDDKKFLEEVKTNIKDIEMFYENIWLKEAVKRAMHVAKISNVYFQEQEPWKLIKTDKERAGTVLNVLANVVKDLSILIEPFMPDIASKINKMLGIKQKKWQSLGKLELKKGQALGKPEILFKKLENDEMKKLKEQYGGKRVQAFSLLNLKVAKILEAKPHPDAEKLLVLQIDLGTEKRQIVAGIRKQYDVKELVGKLIVVVTNLEKAKLRGQESNGMLLAAEDAEGKLGLLTVNAKPGTQVTIRNIEPSDKKITFKEFEQVELKATGGWAVHKRHTLKADNKKVTVERIQEGKIR